MSASMGGSASEITSVHRARHREIAASLRDRFGVEFDVGDRLPGIAALQQEYDVAGLNTVRSALRLLVDEGLVRTEPGVGSFVTASPSPRRPTDEGPVVTLRIDVPSRVHRLLAARASAAEQALDASRGIADRRRRRVMRPPSASSDLAVLA